jgi:hypothetical protein
MFEALSIASAATVFIALGFIAFRMPALLVKPSTLFLVFFCLQVQVSAAINAGAIQSSLANPWTFFILVQVFPLACLGVAFLFQRREAESLYERTGGLASQLLLPRVIAAVALLLVLCYLIVAIYLALVPLTKTGLYAALFAPEMHDSYRELSLKLLQDKRLAYLFTILEKVLAPITGAVCALLIGLAWRTGRYKLALLAAGSAVLAVIPAMLSGARGPGAMVVLAALFAWFLAFPRRLTIVKLAMALFLILLPPVAVMVAKSQAVTVDVVLFQTANTLDRIIGRGYIDNVWHLKHVENKGLYGIAALEKIAPLVNLVPRDTFNEVAIENKGRGTSFGLTALETKAPQVAGSSGSTRTIGEALRCNPQEKVDCVTVEASASAGASFVIMNYAIFGWPGLALSFVFVMAMDLLIWLYKRIDSLMLIPAIAASVVPLLGLSFGLFTTALASKGLLLIPLFCLVFGWAFGKVFPPQGT